MTYIIEEDIEWVISHTDWERFRNKKILITGASGAIARYLVFYFMMLTRKYDANCAVYALVQNEEKANILFGEYLKSEKFHLIVRRVEASGDQALGMNYVFHAAGISVTAMFSKKPVEVLQANLIGTYLMLEKIARQKEGILNKFVFFSSGAVYGQIPNSETDLVEGVYYAMDALTDSGVYAEGKRTGELLCYAYGKEYQIPTVMARIGHSYGPGTDIYDGHVYSDFMRAIIERKPIIINNPKTERPFTYVRDTVFGILMMALRGVDGHAYNLWNVDGKMTVGHLACILTKDIFRDRNLNVYCGGQIYEYIEEEENSVSKRAMDTDKLETLGWKPTVDTREGFLRAIKSLESEK